MSSIIKLKTNEIGDVNNNSMFSKNGLNVIKDSVNPSEVEAFAEGLMREIQLKELKKQREEEKLRVLLEEKGRKVFLLNVEDLKGLRERTFSFDSLSDFIKSQAGNRNVAITTDLSLATKNSKELVLRTVRDRKADNTTVKTNVPLNEVMKVMASAKYSKLLPLEKLIKASITAIGKHTQTVYFHDFNKLKSKQMHIKIDETDTEFCIEVWHDWYGGVN